VADWLANNAARAPGPNKDCRVGCSGGAEGPRPTGADGSTGTEGVWILDGGLDVSESCATWSLMSAI
jgi:hypothetical protein